MAPENRSGVPCRFCVGDRAVVRDHSGVRGCSVEVTGVDDSRGVVSLRMQVWPAQPPAEFEMRAEAADDLLELQQ